MKQLPAARIVLGLALLALARSTHARPEQVPGKTGRAQDENQTSTNLLLPTDEAPGQQTTKTDGSTGKSVVVNWKLACKQLCSKGLGGPGCGAVWLRGTITEGAADTTQDVPVDQATLDGVCPSLCSNGLGVTKCDCRRNTPKLELNQHLVCQAFCSAAHTKLDGCSPCDGTYAGQGPVLALETIQTTTPNWDELCTAFCKVGDGGSLCHCDLPPFF